jgi:hypothetical protein
MKLNGKFEFGFGVLVEIMQGWRAKKDINGHLHQIGFDGGG